MSAMHSLRTVTLWFSNLKEFTGSVIHNHVKTARLILGFRSLVVKVRTDLVPVTGVPVKQAACFFINTGALPGEVEMDSDD